MNEQAVFVKANEALKKVVDQISGDHQWDMKVPDEMTRRPGTLREVINYHAYDDAWVPDTLAGKTIDEVGSAYDGDLLGDDPAAGYARYNERANAAVRDCDDLDRTVHLSYGDFSAREYISHITTYRGLRVYDVAKLIGADTTLPDDLVQGLWDQISPHVEEWRRMGVFGPKVEVSADAPLQDRLLGMTGRDPRA